MEILIQRIQENIGDLLGQSIGVGFALIFAAIVLLITAFMAKWVRRGVALTIGRTALSLSLRSLFVQTSYITAWIIGILVACVIAFPDLRLGDLIGLLGLSSVAVGFAFQDIFKNFLAGILLLIQEPFRIGDQIQIGDYEGTVEDIAIRSTQIRTYQGDRIVIPNAIVFTSPVQVLTAFPQRRTDLAFGIDYNTPLEEAIHIIRETASRVEGVLLEPFPLVDIVGFGESSINLVIRYWTKPMKADTNLVQTRMIMAIKQSCERHKISIPYPIQTVYWFDQDKLQNDQPKVTPRK
jgi:small conductance mechanosensitive channel